MRALLWIARSLLEPVIAIVLLASWAHLELLRPDEHTSTWAALLIAAALGTARIAPRVSLAFVVATFVVQVAQVDLRFDQEMWFAYAGLLLVAMIQGAYTEGEVRRSAKYVLSGTAVAIALMLVLPSLSWSAFPGLAYDFSTKHFAATAPFGTVTGDPWQNLRWIPWLFAWAGGSAGLFLAAWLAGSSYRARRLGWAADDLRHAAEAALDTSEAELELAIERDRIAQDVHDVTAHSLSVILAQADGARAQDRAAARSPESDAALTAIAASARSSLVEIRSLLENLAVGPTSNAAKGAADLDELLAPLRAVGADIRLEQHGEPVTLTPIQSLAIYRIVQEAATNVLKHASLAEPTRIALDWRESGAALTITSPLAGPDAGAGAAPTAEFAGRGITGMRERARLAGGWLTAGPDGGAFIVTAHIPNRAAARADPARADAAGVK